MYTISCSIPHVRLHCSFVSNIFTSPTMLFSLFLFIRSSHSVQACANHAVKIFFYFRHEKILVGHFFLSVSNSFSSLKIKHKKSHKMRFPNKLCPMESQIVVVIIFIFMVLLRIFRWIFPYDHTQLWCQSDVFSMALFTSFLLSSFPLVILKFYLLFSPFLVLKSSWDEGITACEGSFRVMSSVYSF